MPCLDAPMVKKMSSLTTTSTMPSLDAPLKMSSPHDVTTTTTTTMPQSPSRARFEGRRARELVEERETGSDELSEFFLETESTYTTWVLCEWMLCALHLITHVLILCFHLIDD
ncbi:hypothetical protein YC2023_113262 [Brassica napus]